MNFIQQFVSAHPGWGLAYLIVIALFVLTVVSILAGGPKRRGD